MAATTGRCAAGSAVAGVRARHGQPVNRGSPSEELLGSELGGPDVKMEPEVNRRPDVSRVNPFVHKLVWDDPIDKIKTATLTVILLPFRVMLILVCLVVAWALANIGLYGLSKEDLRSRPLAGWRRWLRYLTALVMRLLFLFGSFNYIRYKGVRASPKQAPILCVAPHTAFFDSICVVLFGPSAVVAKYETASLPFFGKLIDYAQPIYVCRENPSSRQSTIVQIIERAKSKDDWPQILIFPEGTCTNRTSLIKFKPGAFYPGVPIQPVLMRYPNKVDTVTWTWEGPSAFQLLWRTLTTFHTFCEIEFLPVYYPNQEEQSDPLLYAHNVRNVMAEALDIPISNYTFNDCKLMAFVKNIRMPHASDIADIVHLRKKLGLTREEQTIVRLMNLENTNNYVTFPKFAKLLGQIFCDQNFPDLLELFNIFAKPLGPNLIDIRDYLLMALFVVNLQNTKLDFLEDLFWLNGTVGRVNITQLKDCLKYLVRMEKEELNSLFAMAANNETDTINIGQLRRAIGRLPPAAAANSLNDGVFFP